MPKIEIIDQNGVGGELRIFAGTLVGIISDGDKVCWRIFEIENTIFIKNFNGDIEGYIGGGLVDIIIAVGYEQCRPAAQLEMGTIIETNYGDIEGYIGGGLVGIIDDVELDIEKGILVG